MKQKKISKIETFFDRMHSDFDTIYTHNKSKRVTYSKIIDKLFRKSIYSRYKLTLKKAGNLKNKKVLDAGCGTGFYAIELAKHGAKVTGIDVSQKMLDTAKKRAKSFGIEKNCKFIKKDLFNHNPSKKYDLIIGMGLFDYVNKPVKLIKKIKSLTKDKLLLSFPVKYNIWTPQRKIRYWLKKCPLYFYSKRDLIRIIRKCLVKRYKIIKINRDYFVSIDLKDK